MYQRRIQIVDLDGCIADDRWRRSLIEIAREGLTREDPGWQGRFNPYHSMSIFDEAVNLREVLEPDFVVLTGRPTRFIDISMRWLKEVAGMVPMFLLTRNNDDHSPSVVLKRRMVRGLLDVNSYNIQLEELVLAIDDRDDVVAMYREEFGLNAKVVRIGEEEHELG